MAVTLGEYHCRVRDSFSGVSRRGVGLKSGTRLRAPLLALVACCRPMGSHGKAPREVIMAPEVGLFMITLRCKECLTQREVRGTSHRTHVRGAVFRQGA